MNYLKLETCLLLEKSGCKSSSGKWWCFDYDDPSPYLVEEKQRYDLEQIGETAWYQAFTWDDICTRENAIKIYGEKPYPSSVSDFMYQWELANLLIDKLDDDDWEAELFKHLVEQQGISEVGEFTYEPKIPEWAKKEFEEKGSITINSKNFP